MIRLTCLITEPKIGIIRIDRMDKGTQKRITVVVVVCVILAILAFLIYTSWGVAIVLWMLEDPKWLVTTIIAASAAVPELWYRSIGPYLARHRQESAGKKQAIDWRIQKCGQLKQAVHHHIEDRVKNYQFDLVGEMSGGWGQGPTPEVEGMMRTYYEKVQECSDWLEASKRVLKLILLETMESKFPESKATYLQSGDVYLQDLFEHILIDPTIRGEQVSIPWLQDNRPEDIEKILGKVDESEKENIDKFFKEFHDTSNRESSLQTLRRKREELIAFAARLEQTAGTERQRLEDELKRL